MTEAEADEAERSERNRGPCGHPWCPTPECDGGQWYKIKNLTKQKVRDGAICVCKKPDCRRYFGMQPPKQPPGRKRQAVAQPAAAEGVQDHWELMKIKSILGFRCTACARRRLPVSILLPPMAGT